LIQIIDLGPRNGLVLGRVLAMHIQDKAVLDVDRCHVDTPGLKLVGRMHGAGWYTRTSDLFQIARISPDDWEKKKNMEKKP